MALDAASPPHEAAPPPVTGRVASTADADRPELTAVPPPPDPDTASATTAPPPPVATTPPPPPPVSKGPPFRLPKWAERFGQEKPERPEPPEPRLSKGSKPPPGAKVADYDDLIRRIDEHLAEIETAGVGKRAEKLRDLGELCRDSAAVRNDPALAAASPSRSAVLKKAFEKPLEPAGAFRRFRDEAWARRLELFGPPEKLPPEPYERYRFRPETPLPRERDEHGDVLFRLFDGSQVRGIEGPEAALKFVPAAKEEPSHLLLRPEPGAKFTVLPLKTGPFADFEMRFRLRLADAASSVSVAFRTVHPAGGKPTNHAFSLAAGKAAVSRGWEARDYLDTAKVPAVSPGRWADVRVIAFRQTFQVFVDDVCVLSKTLTDPATPAGPAGPAALVVAGGESNLRDVRLAVFDPPSRR
jgi:hypothetical protein